LFIFWIFDDDEMLGNRDLEKHFGGGAE